MADIVCPLCGTTYKGLNLDETNGWFICTKYDIDLCLPGYGKKVKIPLQRRYGKSRKVSHQSENGQVCGER